MTIAEDTSTPSPGPDLFRLDGRVALVFVTDHFNAGKNKRPNRFRRSCVEIMSRARERMS
jgi:hypothetical protein